MTLTDFLRQTNLDNSLLIGYYGGGNYGDELLLEVLGNLLARKGVQNLSVAYQKPEAYCSMHHEFGFRIINIHSQPAVIGAALRSKHILIGGGGLWGVDINTNTFLLSIFLFVSRWVLMKKIYLLGVGYYNSTSVKGRLAAWFAGKAANLVIARDPESVQNFNKVSKHVYQDTDIAWHAGNLDPATYKNDVVQLTERMPVATKTLMLALRRPQAKRQREDFIAFNQRITKLILHNLDRPMMLIMLESEAKDPSLYEQARSWMRQHPHLRILEAPYNPLTLFLFIKQHHKRLAIIAPQLHLIMTAHLNGVPFLPIVYDNKVAMLLDQVGVPSTERLQLSDVTDVTLQTFTDNFFGGTK